MTTPLLYSTHAAAEELQVSVDTVRRLIREGAIDTVLVRSKVRISAKQLSDYVTRLERQHHARQLRVVGKRG